MATLTLRLFRDLFGVANLKKTNETKGKIKSQHIHMKNKAKPTESCSKYHY